VLHAVILLAKHALSSQNIVDNVSATPHLILLQPMILNSKYYTIYITYQQLNQISVAIHCYSTVASNPLIGEGDVMLSLIPICAGCKVKILEVLENNNFEQKSVILYTLKDISFKL